SKLVSMSDAYNLWKPEYLLEIGEVDEQHKHFFSLCARLAQMADCQAGKSPNTQDMIRAVTGLRSYAFFHFHTEETYLAKHAYPKLFVHLKEHDAYLDKIREIVDELMRVCQGEGCRESALLELATVISDWAANWWENHILTHDKGYALYIKGAKGRTKS
ncbi:MAG: hemerythrin family protein, partial [Proteobacteria bacterium]|nr:hemerythrin family protein [Pseudomonadota bacterium]